eukprot:gene8581-4728_t
MAGIISMLAKLLTEYRGMVIVLFVLPGGYIFDAVIALVAWITKLVGKGFSSHTEKVEYVQSQVKAWALQPVATRKPMCTNRQSWINLSTRFVDKTQLSRINIGQTLSFSTPGGQVTVEPMVTVGQATKVLNPLGWTLACTLEIMDATIGGLCIAVGMTTHSHRVGLIQETVLWYDVVIASGEVVRASPTENKELYYALPWSHGTLGFVVALELKLVRSKPFIKLEYLPFNTMESYCKMIRQLSCTDADPPDFVEATIYSREQAVVTVGRFTELPSDPMEQAKVNRLGLWFKPWWYKHAETYLKSGAGHEYVPLRDYLLRHNRSIFWVVADMIPFGNDPWFRYLLGWACPPKPAFLKFSTTASVRKMTFTHQVFQDITLPMTDLEKSIDLSEEVFDTYPVLVYPCRVYDHKIGSVGQIRAPRKSDMHPGKDWGMFFDLGVYGVPGAVKQKKPYNPTTAYRRMEHHIRDVGGYPFLYADTFFTEEEFEQCFDLEMWRAARKKHHGDGAFPTLFKKIHPELDVAAAGEEAALHFTEVAKAAGNA